MEVTDEHAWQNDTGRCIGGGLVGGIYRWLFGSNCLQRQRLLAHVGTV
jgi:hypothetical protein